MSEINRVQQNRNNRRLESFINCTAPCYCPMIYEREKRKLHGIEHVSQDGQTVISKHEKGNNDNRRKEELFVAV